MGHTKTTSRAVALIVQAWRKSAPMFRTYDNTRPKAGVSRDEIKDLFYHDLYGALVRRNALARATPRTETSQADEGPIMSTPQTDPLSLVHRARKNRIVALMARDLRRIVVAAEPVPLHEPLVLKLTDRIGIANSNFAPNGNLPDPRRLHLTMAG